MTPLDGRRSQRLAIAWDSSESPRMLPPQRIQQLSQHAAVEVLDLATCTPQSLAAIDPTIVVTTWGFPRLEGDLLKAMPQLEFVMHAGSSVKHLVSEELWARQIRVSGAGGAMARAVAELSFTHALLLRRGVARMDREMHEGTDWARVRELDRRREIRGARVGIVGASRTGREFIALSDAVGAESRVYDPHILAGDPLQGRRTDLESLIQWSEVLAVHAPLTEETLGMISASLLDAMPDGTALVNTARAGLIDMDALYTHVADGRLDAALDVFENEPLLRDSRWRTLPNAVLTPHIGGATDASRSRAGAAIVDEISRYVNGRDLQFEVHRDQLGSRG